MIVETKFNIGDTLYTLHNNKIREITVKSIDILIRDYGIQERYISKEKFPISYDSSAELVLTIDKVFATKEELLKSL